MPRDPLSEITDRIGGPTAKVRRIAEEEGFDLDLADDFLNVTGGIESGNKHRVGKRVLTSPAGALGFAQVMPDVKGGTTRTIGKRKFNLLDEDDNIRAGLNYFAEGGADPVARRIGYLSGHNSRAVRHYKATGKIPKGGDPYTGVSFSQYVAASKGQKLDPLSRLTQDPLTRETEAEVADDPLSAIVSEVNSRTPAPAVAKPRRKLTDPIDPTEGVGKVPGGAAGRRAYDLNAHLAAGGGRGAGELRKTLAEEERRAAMVGGDFRAPGLGAGELRRTIGREQRGVGMGVGELRRRDDATAAQVVRIQQEIAAQQTPAEKAARIAPGSLDRSIMQGHLNEDEEVVRRLQSEQKSAENQREAETRRKELIASLTPEDVHQMQLAAARMRSQGEISRGIETGSQRIGSGLLYKIAGLLDIEGKLPASAGFFIPVAQRKQLANYLRRQAGRGELSIEEIQADIPPSQREQAAEFITQALGALPEIYLATATGGTVGGFAALAGAEAAGRGESPGKIVAETAKGAALGKVFEGARAFERPITPGMNKLGQRLANIARSTPPVAAGTVGVEAVSGANPQDAATSAAANVLFHVGGRLAGEAGPIRENLRHRNTRRQLIAQGQEVLTPPGVKPKVRIPAIAREVPPPVTETAPAEVTAETPTGPKISARKPDTDPLTNILSSVVQDIKGRVAKSSPKPKPAPLAQSTRRKENALHEVSRASGPEQAKHYADIARQEGATDAEIAAARTGTAPPAESTQRSRMVDRWADKLREGGAPTSAVDAVVNSFRSGKQTREEAISTLKLLAEEKGIGKPAPDESTLQPRRQRNVATGRKGQFKKKGQKGFLNVTEINNALTELAERVPTANRRELRGRLMEERPELFKYATTREKADWLAGMITGPANAPGIWQEPRVIIEREDFPDIDTRAPRSEMQSRIAAQAREFARERVGETRGPEAHEARAGHTAREAREAAGFRVVQEKGGGFAVTVPHPKTGQPIRSGKTFTDIVKAHEYARDLYNAFARPPESDVRAVQETLEKQDMERARELMRINPKLSMSEAVKEVDRENRFETALDKLKNYKLPPEVEAKREAALRKLFSKEGDITDLTDRDIDAGQRGIPDRTAEVLDRFYERRPWREKYEKYTDAALVKEYEQAKNSPADSPQRVSLEMELRSREIDAGPRGAVELPREVRNLVGEISELKSKLERENVGTEQPPQTSAENFADQQYAKSLIDDFNPVKLINMRQGDITNYRMRAQNAYMREGVTREQQKALISIVSVLKGMKATPTQREFATDERGWMPVDREGKPLTDRPLNDRQDAFDVLQEKLGKFSDGRVVSWDEHSRKRLETRGPRGKGKKNEAGFVNVGDIDRALTELQRKFPSESDKATRLRLMTDRPDLFKRATPLEKYIFTDVGTHLWTHYANRLEAYIKDLREGERRAMKRVLEGKYRKGQLQNEEEARFSVQDYRDEIAKAERIIADVRAPSGERGVHIPGITKRAFEHRDRVVEYARKQEGREPTPAKVFKMPRRSKGEGGFLNVGEIRKAINKLTDEKGERLRFYHGSPNKNLSELRATMMPVEGDYGRGIYFTSDRKDATDYSRGRTLNVAFQMGELKHQPPEGRVYEFDPPWEKPLIIRNSVQYQQLETAALKHLERRPGDEESVPDWAYGDRAIAAAAKKAGFDGIINQTSGEHVYWGTKKVIPRKGEAGFLNVSEIESALADLRARMPNANEAELRKMVEKSASPAAWAAYELQHIRRLSSKGGSTLGTTTTEARVSDEWKDVLKQIKDRMGETGPVTAGGNIYDVTKYPKGGKPDIEKISYWIEPAVEKLWVEANKQAGKGKLKAQSLRDYVKTEFDKLIDTEFSDWHVVNRKAAHAVVARRLSQIAGPTPEEAAKSKKSIEGQRKEWQRQVNLWKSYDSMPDAQLHALAQKKFPEAYRTSPEAAMDRLFRQIMPQIKKKTADTWHEEVMNRLNAQELILDKEAAKLAAHEPSPAEQATALKGSQTPTSFHEPKPPRTDAGESELAPGEKVRRLWERLATTHREAGTEAGYNPEKMADWDERAHKLVKDFGTDAALAWYSKAPDSAVKVRVGRILGDHLAIKAAAGDEAALAQAVSLANDRVLRSTEAGREVKAHDDPEYKLSLAGALEEATRLYRQSVNDATARLPAPIAAKVNKAAAARDKAKKKVAKLEAKVASEPDIPPAEVAKRAIRIIKKNAGKPSASPPEALGMGLGGIQMRFEVPPSVRQAQKQKSQAAKTFRMMQRKVGRYWTKASHPHLEIARIELRRRTRELATQLEALRANDQGFMRRLGNTTRSLMVSAFPSASRNAQTQVGRSGMERLTDAAELTLRRSLGLQSDVTGRDIAKNYLRQFKASRGFATEILSEFPDELSRIFATYAGGVNIPQPNVLAKGVKRIWDGVDNFAYHMNFFNRAQEFHVRSAEFLADLEIHTKKATGMTLEQFIARNGPEKLPPALIKRAVNRALEVTFAANPPRTTATGQKLNWLIEFGNALPPTISPVPFPRYMYNSLKFLYQYNPISGAANIAHAGLTNRAVSKRVGALRARTDLTTKERDAAINQLLANRRNVPRAIAQQMLGTLMLTLAYQVRTRDLAGEKWYELKTKLGTFDTRPFGPFSTYLLMAEAIRRKRAGERDFTLKEWLEGLGASSPAGGISISAAERIYGYYENGDYEKMGDLLAREAGETVRAAFTPVRQIKDIISQFDESQRITRDTKDRPILGPLAESLPYVSEKLGLPEAHRYTSGRPVQQENPLGKFITGYREVAPKNFIETELDRLKFRPQEIRRYTGIPKLDNAINRHAGPILDAKSAELRTDPEYVLASDAEKFAIMREALQSAYQAGMDAAAEELPDEYSKYKSKKPYWKRKLEEEAAAPSP